jgi:hypothetical protein
MTASQGRQALIYLGDEAVRVDPPTPNGFADAATDLIPTRPTIPRQG